MMRAFVLTMFVLHGVSAVLTMAKIGMGSKTPAIDVVSLAVAGGVAGWAAHLLWLAP